MPIFLSLNSRHARWLPSMIGLALAVAALASTWAIHRWCADAGRNELASQRAALAMIDQATRTKAPICAPEMAYAQSLPASISLDKLVQSLQDSAKAFGVTVLSVDGEPHPANERSLSTLVVGMALHGGYAGIKSTLAEGLSRFPGAALQEMHLKRAGAAQLAVEDASVQVVFVLRPAASGPNDCRMPAVDTNAARTR